MIHNERSQTVTCPPRTTPPGERDFHWTGVRHWNKTIQARADHPPASRGRDQTRCHRDRADLAVIAGFQVAKGLGLIAHRDCRAAKRGFILPSRPGLSNPGKQRPRGLEMRVLGIALLPVGKVAHVTLLT